jgi:hypothetical protein
MSDIFLVGKEIGLSPFLQFCRMLNNLQPLPFDLLYLQFYFSVILGTWWNVEFHVLVVFVLE